MSSSDKTVGEGATVESYEHGLDKLANPHIHLGDSDYLYHLSLGTCSDIQKDFGDVKFVLTGGKGSRMKAYATALHQQIPHLTPGPYNPVNLTGSEDRFSMYKVGPVLCVSHGMGVPSLSIMMHEVIKLLFHARCKGVTFFRMGTCGGVGLRPGSVVVSTEAVNGQLKPVHELVVLGRQEEHPSRLDQSLVAELLDLGRPEDHFQLVGGKTLCTMDFYEGQARLDGAFCEYTADDKMNFLRSLQTAGVKNIEMESVGFAALTHRAGVRGAVVCVTLLDRLQDDQLDEDLDMEELSMRPLRVVSRYISKQLHGN